MFKTEHSLSASRLTYWHAPTVKSIRRVLCRWWIRLYCY